MTELITRKQAKALGHIRYFTGRPCSHGHTAERFVCNHLCIDCHNGRANKSSQKKTAKAAVSLMRQLQEANPGKDIITLAQATAVGLKWYFTGKPCRNGHACERLVSNRSCRICAYAKAKAAKWWIVHSKEMVAKAKAWAEANPEKSRISKEHRNRIRGARSRGAGGSHTPKDIKAIFTAQIGKCAYYRYCGTTITLRTKHTDHIVPVSAGGSNNPDNLQLTCRSCNHRKHAKDPLKFGLSVGVLNGRMAYAKVMAILGE